MIDVLPFAFAAPMVYSDLSPAMANTLQLVNERIWAMFSDQIDTHGLFWLMLGFAGQGLFFMRFLWQWISSESAGRSRLPIAFWYFSLAGSLILCSYAAFKKSGFDPVFFLAGPLQIVIYLRNLMLIYKHDQNETTTDEHCSKCGSATVANANYCWHCGHALKDVDASEPTAEPAAATATGESTTPSA